VVIANRHIIGGIDELRSMDVTGLACVRRLPAAEVTLITGAVLPALLGAQTGRGPYARIAVLRPHDGQNVEFEAGYLRHLAWHQGAKDPWTWYGWSIWAGDRNRWFVYATFGHSASSLDSAVTPGEDRRAAADPSARVHHGRSPARSGQGLRGGGPRGPVATLQ
jgi:hypothetical protein